MNHTEHSVNFCCGVHQSDTEYVRSTCRKLYRLSFIFVLILINLSALHQASRRGNACWWFISWCCADFFVCVIVHTYLCNWVMSCIHTEGAGSSHRLSSEGRTSTAAFSTQGSTGPSAGTQCCTYIYSAVNISVHPVKKKTSFWLLWPAFYFTIN